MSPSHSLITVLASYALLSLFGSFSPPLSSGPLSERVATLRRCLRGSTVSIRYEQRAWRFLTVLGAFVEGWSLIRVSRSPSLPSSWKSWHDVILAQSLFPGICSYSSISSSSNSHILPLEFPSFFSSLGGTVVKRMRRHSCSSSSLSSSLPLVILIAEMTGLSSIQA